MNIKRRLFLKLFALTGAALFAGPLYALNAKRKPPTTTEELYAAMSRALPVGPSTVMQWSVTGEEYVEYAMGLRIFPEAVGEIEPEKRLCAVMWRTFLGQLAKLDGGDYRIYWRMPPEFVVFLDDFDEELGGFAQQKARIYTRYLISDKPPKFTREELMASRRQLPNTPSSIRVEYQ